MKDLKYKHPIIKGYGSSTMPEDRCPRCSNNFVWVNGMNRCDNCGNTWVLVKKECSFCNGNGRGILLPARRRNNLAIDCHKCDGKGWILKCKSS